MAAARIVEPIDILEYCPFGLASCFPTVTPDKFSLALRDRVLRSNVPRGMDLKNVSTMQCLTGDLQSKSAERGLRNPDPVGWARCNPHNLAEKFNWPFFFPGVNEGEPHPLPSSACLHAREGVLACKETSRDIAAQYPVGRRMLLNPFVQRR